MTGKSLTAIGSVLSQLTSKTSSGTFLHPSGKTSSSGDGVTGSLSSLSSVGTAGSSLSSNGSAGSSELSSSKYVGSPTALIDSSSSKYVGSPTALIDSSSTKSSPSAAYSSV